MSPMLVVIGGVWLTVGCEDQRDETCERVDIAIKCDHMLETCGERSRTILRRGRYSGEDSAGGARVREVQGQGERLRGVSALRGVAPAAGEVGATRVVTGDRA